MGVARQYSGALGKIANCQAGVFLAHVRSMGRVLVDKRLYLRECLMAVGMWYVLDVRPGMTVWTLEPT